MLEVCPQLSVVIPTLGRPILVRTLESLLAADGSDVIEIIVAGRLPEGDVLESLRKFQQRHPHLQHLAVQFEKGDSSEKKNAGFRASRAALVAFIDDDVIVAKNWPQKITEPFRDPAVGLVSGPALVPSDISRMGRLAGVALASKAAGYVAERYLSGGTAPREVKWSRLIGCNMAYRKSVLADIGGFDPAFWPGEEMIASFRATQRGQKLVFHPDAYLYHYPRSSLSGYARQMWGYGATRIRLMRAGVEFEPTTILPALWVLWLFVLGLAAPFCGLFCLWLLVVSLVVYLAGAIFITVDKVMETRRLSDALMLPLVPLTHISYGIAQWVEVFRPGRDLSVKK